MLMAANDMSHPKIPEFRPKLRSKGSSFQTKITLAVKVATATRLLNMALAANLILLSNDISLNPGPSTNFPANMKGLRVFHLNICSLRNKLDELRLFCDKYQPHVLSLNETWLDNSFMDNEISLPGYNLMRRDRNRNGGGLVVYVAENLGFNQLENNAIIPPIDENIEAIWFELTQPKTKNILIGAFYRPPHLDPSIFINNLERGLANFTKDGIETILLGDFNFDYAAPSMSSTTKNLQRVTRIYCLKQIITTFTRITQHSKTLIDLFFTSRPELYSSGVIQIGFSDHLAIVGVRKLHRIKPMPPKTVEVRNYKNYDSELFKTDLSYVPWDILEMEPNPEEAWNSFKDLFKTVADSHAPVSTRRVRGRSLPWITREVKNLMKERDYYHKKAMKTNQEIYWSNYKRLRNAVTGKLRKEKSIYYSSQLTGKQDSKQMWSTLNDLLPKKKNTTSTRYQNLTATAFNQYFTQIPSTLCKHFGNTLLPLIMTPRVNRDFALNDVSSSFVHNELRELKGSKATGLDGIPAKLLKDGASVIAKPIAHLINLTIRSGEIPLEWKEAKVIPIFKSGKRNEENNYRPISVLPLISKIMERSIQTQLVAFLTENNVLSVHQSGFRKNHSTETAVIHVVDHILQHMDKQQVTGAVFVDLKKAFDLVDHECLFYKLEHYGIRGQTMSWFRNYLTNRTQRVNYANELSPSRVLNYGVPQGSVLGPLLFVLHINDLPKCLLSCSISMYADDTIIYFSGSDTNEIMETLQNDLDRVAQWMTSSRLVLNYSKTKVMLFGTKQKLGRFGDFTIQLQGKLIERVPKFSYLGVMLDEQISWKEHTEEICNKVSKRLGLLSRIRSCLTIDASKCVYNSVVQPIFDYTDAVWSELPAGCSQSLQKLQNRAARIILQRESSRNTFDILNWVDLSTRRQIHKCVLVFKCLNNLVPEYLSGYFVKNSNIHSYNTRRKDDLHLPKPNLSLGKRSFIYSGSLLYNNLPDRIKKAGTLSNFKSLIQRHSF
jgi:exonuclease III